MTKRVDFYFDFISPFGYLASLRIDEMAARHGHTCDWHAMLLGVSVLKVMGMKPLPQTPLKGAYLKRDLARYLSRRGLVLARDLNQPPPNPLPAARAFHGLKAHDATLARRVAQALFHALWMEDRDIGDPAVATAVAVAQGADDAFVRRAIATGGQGDQALRAAVEASLARGVFGSPFFMVGEEPFFGLEKMELVEEWITDGGW